MPNEDHTAHSKGPRIRSGIDDQQVEIFCDIIIDPDGGAVTNASITMIHNSSSQPLLLRINHVNNSSSSSSNNNNRRLDSNNIDTDENDDWCDERYRRDIRTDTTTLEDGGGVDTTPTVTDDVVPNETDALPCCCCRIVGIQSGDCCNSNSIALRIVFPWMYHNSIEAGSTSLSSTTIAAATASFTTDSSSSISRRRRIRENDHRVSYCWCDGIIHPYQHKNDSVVAIVVGITTLMFIGSIIGTISYYITSQQSSSTPVSHTDLVSSFIVYSYFIMWSVSFYPQCLLNRQRRTCTGLSIDFCWYNFIGFICYTTYNVALYGNPTIQHQYDERHHQSPDHSSTNSTIPIQANDVAFAVHALILCTILLLHVAYYDGISALRPSRQSSYILTVILLCIVLYPIIFLLLYPMFIQKSTYQTLDYIYFLSYIKVSITCMKYIPQVYYNYHRRSTVGWNIWQIFLDLFGGILSTVQLMYDAPSASASDVIVRNLPKFMLGNISIVFDIIFIVQHYYLYPTTGTGTREQSHFLLPIHTDERDPPSTYQFLSTSNEDEKDADV